MRERDKARLRKALDTLRNPGGGLRLVSHGFGNDQRPPAPAPPPPPPSLTDLERQVLSDLVEGRDPWRHHRGSSSRPISQAVSRLKRKGYVVPDRDATVPTNLGRELIKSWREEHLEKRARE